jgi:hypothetical protein
MRRKKEKKKEKSKRKIEKGENPSIPLFDQNSFFMFVFEVLFCLFFKCCGLHCLS